MIVFLADGKEQRMDVSPDAPLLLVLREKRLRGHRAMPRLVRHYH